MSKQQRAAIRRKALLTGKTPERVTQDSIRDALRACGIHAWPNVQRMPFGTAGAPDLIVHLPGVAEGRIVYLEVKTFEPGSKKEKSQREFEAQCKRDRVPYFVARSVEEAAEALKLPLLF